jgi:hypothetical protein
VNGIGYKLVGYLAWQGAKWYLRRRLPSGRAILLAGLGAGVAATAAVALAKRAAG